MAQKPSKIREFQKRFPDEDSCLTHLMRNRFGERFTCFKCQKQATYYRVKARRSFECEHCGYQVYPTAGTPFEKTRTSLRLLRQVGVGQAGYRVTGDPARGGPGAAGPAATRPA